MILVYHHFFTKHNMLTLKLTVIHFYIKTAQKHSSLFHYNYSFCWYF